MRFVNQKGCIWSFFIALVSFVVLEFIWNYFSWSFYESNIGQLLSGHAPFSAFVLYCLLYIAGVCIFVVAPSMMKKLEMAQVFGLGFLFGLIINGTCDLANMGSLIDWTWSVTIIDTIWGAVQTGLVSIITVALVRNFKLTK
jgi:uncharacterized membrane protein